MCFSKERGTKRRETERKKMDELLEANSQGRMESIDWKMVSEGPEIK